MTTDKLRNTTLCHTDYAPQCVLMIVVNVQCVGYVNLDGEMVNVTAFEGQTIRIRCDVTGFPLPRYRWLLNGHLLLTDDSQRYEARTTVWGSLLVQFVIIYVYLL